MRLVNRRLIAYALLAAWVVFGASGAIAAMTSNGVFLNGSFNGVLLNGLYPNGLYPNGVPVYGTDFGQTFSVESVMLNDGSLITPASK